MKVILSGCGNVGTAILQSLIKEKHDIVVIDTDPQVTREVSNRFDVLTICGNGASIEILEEAGAKNADLFISITSSDEYNMLACFVAKKMGTPNTVARIRNSEYNNKSFDFVKDELGLSITINPEQLTAQTLFNILNLPSATNVETFSASEMEMIEIEALENSKVLGTPLFELRKKSPYKFLVCLVERDGKVYIPNGSFTINAGDKIGLFTSKADAPSLLKMFGFEQKPINSIMIIGASRIAHYLATLLLDAKNSVKVIDKDEQKCIQFAEKLDKATIVNGNGINQELLVEEGILNTDAFIALTGKDEDNVLMSIFAKNKSVPKTITKIKSEEILSLSKELELDTAISPKHLVADLIVSYARALESSKNSKIETLYRLFDGTAEAAEFKILHSFKHTNVPIKDLNIRNDVLVAGIVRGSETIIPCGEDVFRIGDKVIIITAGKTVYDLVDVIG
ncbi:MAG: Trk system potassium transporter TrkA [Clostridia bacterium]|nr:Trk system potassium transporter TrkA [Clostridia bacterium]